MADDANTTESTESTENANVEFDGEFDADRAKRKIAAIAADKAKLQERLAQFERDAQARADAEKSEVQKAIERAERAEAALETRTKADSRREVLAKHGLTADDAAFIHGETVEELEIQASALAKRLGVSKKDAEDETPAPVRPKAKLTPGHAGLDSEAFDLDAFVEGLRKNPY